MPTQSMNQWRLKGNVKISHRNIWLKNFPKKGKMALQDEAHSRFFAGTYRTAFPAGRYFPLHACRWQNKRGFHTARAYCPGA